MFYKAEKKAEKRERKGTLIMFVLLNITLGIMGPFRRFLREENFKARVTIVQT